MNLSIQIRKETKFKAKTSTNIFKLDIEVLDPEWASVYVNKKYMNLGTFSFDKDVLSLKKPIEKGSEVLVRDFERIGKIKRQKT